VVLKVGSSSFDDTAATWQVASRSLMRACQRVGAVIALGRHRHNLHRKVVGELGVRGGSKEEAPEGVRYRNRYELARREEQDQRTRF
jgi:hypothetical protein